MFGEIIYDNFLFDIPKILDLCVLFGKGNGQLLHKMIGKVIVNVLSFCHCFRYEFFCSLSDHGSLKVRTSRKYAFAVT